MVVLRKRLGARYLRPVHRSLVALWAAVGCLAACQSSTEEGGSSQSPAGDVPSSSPSAAPQGPAPATPSAGPVAPPPREGGALVRSTRGDVLYLADEDRTALRQISLPLGDKSAGAPLSLPGRP